MQNLWFNCEAKERQEQIFAIDDTVKSEEKLLKSDKLEVGLSGQVPLNE